MKAVLRKGAVVPLEPVPPDWEEGTPLEIAKAAVPSLDVDAWAETMKQLCADSIAEDEERMRITLEEHRLQAKEQMRRRMESPS